MKRPEMSTQAQVAQLKQERSVLCITLHNMSTQIGLRKIVLTLVHSLKHSGMPFLRLFLLSRGLPKG